MIRLFYTFNGTKLRKTVEDNGTITKVDYWEPFVYETTSGTRSLKYLITSEGRAVKNGSTWDYEYNLTDHLGNVRAVIRKGTNGLAELIQQKHYYPFGMEMSQLNLGAGTNKYQYNGKEIQDDFGLYWYDYGARFYDPMLGRWHSIDPLAEKYFRASPYCYALNNPIKFSDINGEDVVLLIAPTGAGNHGHMGAVIQDGNGNWHYMTTGATAGQTSSKLATSGGQGGMVLKNLGTKDKDEAIKLAKQDTENKPYTDQIEFSTSTEMDAEIFSVAGELRDKINSGEEEYHALTNNCADIVETVVKGGTGVDLKSGSSPEPNKKAQNIKKNQKDTQKKIDKKVEQAKEEKRVNTLKSKDKTSKNQY